MKYYVINLDKRTDRFKSFKNEFCKIGSLRDLTRISGVEFQIDSFDLNMTRASCAAAHSKAINEALSKEDDFFTIFEDDVFFYDYTSDLINKSLDFLKNKDWDFLYWGCVPRTDTTTNPLRGTEKDFIKKLMCGGAAHAITYTRKFALQLVEKFPQNLQASSWRSWIEKYQAYDNFLMHFQTQGNCYIPHKICACQSNGYSDIDRAKSNRKDTIEEIFNNFND